MSPDPCPFCGSPRVYYPCVNGQPGDECKCGECGRSWPFKFIEVYQDSCGRLCEAACPIPYEVRTVRSAERSAAESSAPAGISPFAPQGASQGVSDSHLPANSDVVASNNAEGRFKWPADSQVLPPADGTKPSAHREQDADCGIGGEFDLRAPVGPGAQCERPGTSSPVAQDVLGDRGEVCHGESLLHAVGSEMGLSRGGSPLEKFAGERGPVERQPTMARGAHSPGSPAIHVLPTYHPQRGGNSNGLHVTQGSAPESDRHPASALTPDRPQERNGCVAQMDMPRNDAAVTADESGASAGIPFLHTSLALALSPVCPACYCGMHSQCIGQGCYCSCQAPDDSDHEEPEGIPLFDERFALALDEGQNSSNAWRLGMRKSWARRKRLGLVLTAKKEPQAA